MEGVVWRVARDRRESEYNEIVDERVAIMRLQITDGHWVGH